MKTILVAFVATSLYCGVTHAQDPRVNELKEFMATAPKKFMVYDKRNAKRAQFIAEHGVTVNSDLDVLGVDAANGAPDLIWIFRESVIPATCKIVQYADATRTSEVKAFLGSLKPLKKDTELTALIAQNFIAHIACTTDKSLSRKGRMTITIPNPNSFISFNSSEYQGEVTYVAHAEKNKLDLFALPYVE